MRVGLTSIAVAQEFLNLFIKTAFRVLENPNNAREKSARLLCVKMIACLSHKFQVILPSVSSGVIHRLNTLEHISTAMAELMSACVNDYGDNTMVGDVLREIGRIDTSETRDTAGMKNMASFLVRATALVTGVCWAHPLP